MTFRATDAVLRRMAANARDYEREHMTPDEIDRRMVKTILAKLELGETISRDDFVRENIPSDAITYRFRANFARAQARLATEKGAP